jgi:cell wall assembly regulator SMI1
MIPTIDSLFRRLEGWVRRHADAPLRLRPGVAEADLAVAEEALGFALPAELRAFLRVHDGQDLEDDDPDVFPWMPGAGPLSRLEDVVAEWRADRARNEAAYAGHHPIVVSRGRLLQCLWHPRRIPIAGLAGRDGLDGRGGARVWVDLAPGPEGRSGQLAVSPDGIELALYGPSLAEALALHVEALENGEWAWSPGERRLVPVEKRWATGWLRYVEAMLYARPPAPSRPGFAAPPPAPSRPGRAPGPRGA